MIYHKWGGTDSNDIAKEFQYIYDRYKFNVSINGSWALGQDCVKKEAIECVDNFVEDLRQMKIVGVYISKMAIATKRLINEYHDSIVSRK
ncbi:hypothetical protein KB575_00515 [Streptococcus canis]|uniref:hypothetical protein n=1 Tax=Streptococcus canis TaxID=1329 RepID=UPI002949A442|nr:hypothetical protein [Streptococcus canis]MDV5987551.1 hypothetical protein [Streptococcus canis]